MMSLRAASGVVSTADVVQRVAVDHQQVGQRAGRHHAHLSVEPSSRAGVVVADLIRSAGGWTSAQDDELL